MPRQRIGIALIGCAAIAGALDALLVCIVLAILGVVLVDN